MIASGPALVVPPVDRDVLIDGARLRSTRSVLKLPDALHCATAARHGCRAIVTDDRRLPRDVGVPVVRFGPASLAELRVLAA
jgi:predicted nucleic acid-binding protein